MRQAGEDEEAAFFYYDFPWSGESGRLGWGFGSGSEKDWMIYDGPPDRPW
jgi:hypothetical protein